MANLGYWQMKVSPGIWYLQIAPGRSSELYVLKEHDDGSQGKPSTKRITISDLRGKPVHMEVRKRKGKEHEKLLVSSNDDDHSQEKVHLCIFLLLLCFFNFTLIYEVWIEHLCNILAGKAEQLEF